MSQSPEQHKAQDTRMPPTTITKPIVIQPAVMIQNAYQYNVG